MIEYIALLLSQKLKTRANSLINRKVLDYFLCYEDKIKKGFNR